MLLSRPQFPAIVLLIAVASPASARPRGTARRPAAKPAAVLKCQLELPDLKSEAGLQQVLQAVTGVKGVRAAVADLNTRLVVVDYDSGATGLPTLLAACDGAGHPAREYLVESRFPPPVKLKGG